MNNGNVRFGRIVLVLTALLLSACSGAGDEEAPLMVERGLDELGQSRQPLFMPARYGMEHGGNKVGCRTNTAWAGGYCWVPDNVGDNVNIRLTFTSSTCTAASGFFQGQIEAAIQAFKTKVNSTGATATYPASPPGNFINVRCGAIDGTAVGKFVPVANETHSHANGQVAQYKGGTVYIDDWKIANDTDFWNAPLTKQINFAYNVALHEMAHVGGIGHDDVNDGGKDLMDGSFGMAATDVTNKSVWNSKWNLGIILDPLDCYNATSGTGDRCAD